MLRTGRNFPLQDSVKLGAEAENYSFSSEAEADATFLVIAWFAVSESAALGIFPLLSALQVSQAGDTGYFSRFFEEGFQHFRDEQRHANLWCRALKDFTERYPRVVKRAKLPFWLLKIMLKSVGKPHSVLNFGIDCLAFETALRAFYEVAQPRLPYPPLQTIFQVIIRDEEAHTDFGINYIFGLEGPLSRRQRLGVAFRFWRQLAGVIITLRPLLTAIDRHQTLPFKDFMARLAFYASQTGIPGSKAFETMNDER